jgi:hypothetical protein
MMGAYDLGSFRRALRSDGRLGDIISVHLIDVHGRCPSVMFIIPYEWPTVSSGMAHGAEDLEKARKISLPEVLFLLLGRARNCITNARLHLRIVERVIEVMGPLGGRIVK